MELKYVGNMLLVDNFAAHPQDISVIWNRKLCTIHQLHNCGTFHEDHIK